jgi:hypothetical protein
MLRPTAACTDNDGPARSLRPDELPGSRHQHQQRVELRRAELEGDGVEAGAAACGVKAQAFEPELLPADRPVRGDRTHELAQLPADQPRRHPVLDDVGRPGGEALQLELLAACFVEHDDGRGAARAQQADAVGAGRAELVRVEHTASKPHWRSESIAEPSPSTPTILNPHCSMPRLAGADVSARAEMKRQRWVIPEDREAPGHGPATLRPARGRSDETPFSWHEPGSTPVRRKRATGGRPKRQAPSAKRHGGTGARGRAGARARGRAGARD